MSSYNQLSTEKNATAAFIVPQTVNTGTGAITSSVVDARDFEQVGARVTIATVGSADAVITLRQGDSAAMGNAKSLLTTTVTSPSNKFVRMVARGQDFDVDNGFRWVDLQISHDDASGGLFAGEIEGLDGPYQDSTSHTSSVVVVTPYS